MAEVRVEGITKSFGEVAAVDDISWRFTDGQLTVLVGPSGCGKTTLLRIIAGLEEATTGRVYIDGQPVDHVPPWERNAAMVFQSYALYPHMTVFENMAFPLEARKLSKGEIKQQVEKTARSLDIFPLLQRKPKELSGGQMQRVALGRAIVRHPDAYLMDEPLSNLDAKLRVDMRGELKRLQRELGVTTIYVTHDQAEAMTMADTLLVLRDGRIEQAGDPEDIYRHPRTVFVAGFIGSPSMNFIPCRFDAGQGKLVAGNVPLPFVDRLAGPVQGHVGRGLLLGIRPEDLEVSLSPQPGAMPARVYVTEPLGRETLLTLEAEFLSPAGHLRAVAPPELRPAMGEPVWLTFQPSAMHLFDETSENALVL